jgi:ataxin-3
LVPQTDTEDAIKFLAEDSGNVNDSGFFSVEVLRAAVDRFGELKLISAESSEIDSMNIDSEKAFICNRSEHW